ncbi:MAG: fused MFS/spermidine synthase [Candidatus Sumerlaeota bacterium]|nr:fused MFS/spermidine synthase [Candidatus Sumerlaeota bacterium]
MAKSSRATPSQPAPKPNEPAPRRVAFGFLVFTVLMTGGAVMMLEMLGARIAGPVFGVSLYIWTALIAVTLVSLSLGYWLGGALSDRRPRPDVMYGIILIAGLCIAFLPWLDGPVMAASYRALGLKTGVLGSAFALFAAPLTLLGMVSPFAIKLGLADLKRVGKTAGTLYAISTVGSVGGTILTGYALIPILGVARTLFVITAAVLIPPVAWFAGARRWGVMTASALILLVSGSLAVARPGRTLPRDTLIVDCRDSPYGQIKVIDRESDRGMIRWLLLEGTAQTGVYLDSNEVVSNYVRVMQEFLRFHPPRGRKALVVGLGGGALLHPLRELGYDVDVVEIDPVVAEFAAKYFRADPELYHLVPEDGRAYVRRCDKQYDVILYDVFSGGGQPFHFFSREAFQETKRILAPDGVLGLNVISFPKGPRSTMPVALHHTIRTLFGDSRVFVAYPEDPKDDLNNVLMFFAPEEFTDPDPSSLALDDREEWDWLAERLIDYSPAEGLLITDDWNPVDRWTAAVNEVWRQRIFEDMGPEILTY